VATSTIKALIKEGYDTLDKIIALSVDDIISIPKFGEKKALALHNGLIENADRIEDILKSGVTIKTQTRGNLTGKSFCFTGTMKNPRAILQKMVTDNGGEIKKSVGKGLSYLVTDDPFSNSAKSQAARKLGTALISEDDFLSMTKKS
jgi:DNA ligase (NAD+)